MMVLLLSSEMSIEREGSTEVISCVADEPVNEVDGIWFSGIDCRGFSIMSCELENPRCENE